MSMDATWIAHDLACVLNAVTQLRKRLSGSVRVVVGADACALRALASHGATLAGEGSPASATDAPHHGASHAGGAPPPSSLAHVASLLGAHRVTLLQHVPDAADAGAAEPLATTTTVLCVALVAQPEVVDAALVQRWARVGDVLWACSLPRSRLPAHVADQAHHITAPSLGWARIGAHVWSRAVDAPTRWSDAELGLLDASATRDDQHRSAASLRPHLIAACVRGLRGCGTAPSAGPPSFAQGGSVTFWCLGSDVAAKRVADAAGALLRQQRDAALVRSDVDQHAAGAGSNVHVIVVSRVADVRQAVGHHDVPLARALAATAATQTPVAPGCLTVGWPGCAQVTHVATLYAAWWHRHPSAWQHLLHAQGPRVPSEARAPPPARHQERQWNRVLEAATTAVACTGEHSAWNTLWAMEKVLDEPSSGLTLADVAAQLTSLAYTTDVHHVLTLLAYMLTHHRSLLGKRDVSVADDGEENTTASLWTACVDMLCDVGQRDHASATASWLGDHLEARDNGKGALVFHDRRAVRSALGRAVARLQHVAACDVATRSQVAAQLGDVGVSWTASSPGGLCGALAHMACQVGAPWRPVLRRVLRVASDPQWDAEEDADDAGRGHGATALVSSWFRTLTGDADGGGTSDGHDSGGDAPGNDVATASDTVVIVLTGPASIAEVAAVSQRMQLHGQQRGRVVFVALEGVMHQPMVVT